MVSTVSSRDSIATAMVSTANSRDSITFTIFTPRQGLGTASASSPCCVCSPHFSLPWGCICSAIIDYIFAEFDFIISELEIIIAQLDFTFSGHEFIFTVIAPLFGVGVY